MDKGYRDTKFTLTEISRNKFDLKGATQVSLFCQPFFNYSLNPHKTTTDFNLKATTEKLTVCLELKLQIEFEILDEGRLTFIEGFSLFRQGIWMLIDYSNKVTSTLYGDQVVYPYPTDPVLLAEFEKNRNSLS